MFKRLLCVLSALLLCCVGSLTVRASDYTILGQYDYSQYDEYEEEYAEELVQPEGYLYANGGKFLIPNSDMRVWSRVESTSIVYNYHYNADGKTYSSTGSAYFPCDTPYQGMPTEGSIHLNLSTSSLLKAQQPYDITWDMNLIGVTDFEVTGFYLVGENWSTKSTSYTDYEVIYQDDSLIRFRFNGVEHNDTVHTLEIVYNITPVEANIAVYPSEVNVEESSSAGFFASIIEWIKGIYNSIMELPLKIANFIGDKLKELFIPSQSQLRAYFNSWDNMLADRFGAIYQVVQILRDMFNSIIDAASGEPQRTIEMPVVELEFGETVFEFGGWEVEIVPQGFDFLVDALKFALDCVCTVAFIGALRKKYDDLMEDG